MPPHRAAAQPTTSLHSTLYATQLHGQHERPSRVSLRAFDEPPWTRERAERFNNTTIAHLLYPRQPRPRTQPRDNARAPYRHHQWLTVQKWYAPPHDP